MDAEQNADKPIPDFSEILTRRLLSRLSRLPVRSEGAFAEDLFEGGYGEPVCDTGALAGQDGVILLWQLWFEPA